MFWEKSHIVFQENSESFDKQFFFSYIKCRVLRKNELNGTLDIGTSYSNRLHLIDLRRNFISTFENSDEVHDVEIM